VEKVKASQSEINPLESGNFDKLHKLCWEAKPEVESLIAEVKVILSACNKDSAPFLRFLQNLAEKFFNFACNVKAENFEGIGNDTVNACMGKHFPTLTEDCLFKYNPNKFSYGFCE
jgi:hypothetical protein